MSASAEDPLGFFLTFYKRKRAIMKKHYLFLLTIYPCLVYTQNYLPMHLETGTVWYEVASLGLGDTPGSEGSSNTGFSYTLQGDTLVEGVLYQKVYHQLDWFHRRSIHYNGDEAIIDIVEYNYDEPATLIGGLRQDTLEQKVYYRSWEPEDWNSGFCIATHPTYNEDELLYDFSIEVGDTILHESSLKEVSFIDTIVLTDGLERRRYSFDYSDYSWIEGIGSTLGLFGPWGIEPFESGCGFYCYREAGEQVFFNDFYFGLVPDNVSEDCGKLILSTAALWDAERVYIYPNPIVDQFIIDVGHEQNLAKTQLYVFNSLGQLILQEKLRGDQHETLTANWPAGLYYLVLEQDGVMVYRSKVMKGGRGR